MPQANYKPCQYAARIFPLSSYNVGKVLMPYLQLQELCTNVEIILEYS
jgi:hypothetical protein